MISECNCVNELMSAECNGCVGFVGKFALNNVKTIDKGALILYLCNVKWFGNA